MAEASEFEAACAVLGLSTAPSLSEARAAFRERAALLHPDVHRSAGTPRVNAATVAMQQLSEAHRVVVETILARGPNPSNALRVNNGMVRRCTRCRSEFHVTAEDASIVCPRCDERLRGTSPNRRSYSRGRLRAGRLALYSGRLTTPRRTEPIGRLAHIALWHDDR
jgi:hypothetical protein